MEFYDAIQRSIKQRKDTRDNFIYQIEEQYKDGILNKSQYEYLMELLDRYVKK